MVSAEVFDRVRDALHRGEDVDAGALAALAGELRRLQSRDVRFARVELSEHVLDLMASSSVSRPAVANA